MRRRLWALLWIVGCGAPQTHAAAVQPTSPPLVAPCRNAVETPLGEWAHQFEEAQDVETLSALMRAVGASAVPEATDQHGPVDGALTASVVLTPLSIRALSRGTLSQGTLSRGTLVHTRWRVVGERSFEQNRLLVFRPLPRGASCLVGNFGPPPQEERCELAGEDVAMNVTPISLITEDIDALRVDYCSGGGGYGSDRSEPNTHVALLGVEASELKEYLSFASLRWGGEALSPQQRTTTSLTIGAEFPRTLTLHRVRECESTCERQDLIRRAREAEHSDDESLYDTLIQACSLDECWPLDEEETYERRGSGYSRAQPQSAQPQSAPRAN